MAAAKKKPETTPSPVQHALAQIHAARTMDEGDYWSGKLAHAARANPEEVIALYYSSPPTETFTLVWCLQGQTSPRVFALLQHALRHKDGHVRWAASEGLKHFNNAALIPGFVKALKDRSHLVKGVAVEWLRKHGDATAIEPLERLIRLPSMLKHSPGTVDDAKKALARLRAKAK